MDKQRIDEIIRKELAKLLNEEVCTKGKEMTNNGISVDNETPFINQDGIDFGPMTYDYLFDRNNGLPKEYFEPTDIPYDPNEIAMYTIPQDVMRELELNEGLIKTMPTQKSIQNVCNVLNKKGYRFVPNMFFIDEPNDDNSIYGHIRLMIYRNYLNKEIDDTLKHEFDVCGYHLGITLNRIDANGNPCVVYQFEPKFQTNVTNTNIAQYLYHVTTENAAKKIMRQGFCPANRTNNGFMYDGRCYFFTVFNKNLFANYMAQANKKNNIGNGKFNNNYKIITIDRNKLRDTTFFTDPNFGNKIAVFTYSNIPPTAITNCEDL